MAPQRRKKAGSLAELLWTKEEKMEEKKRGFVRTRIYYLQVNLGLLLSAKDFQDKQKWRMIVNWRRIGCAKSRSGSP